MPEGQLVAIFEMYEEYIRHVTIRVQVINIKIVYFIWKYVLKYLKCFLQGKNTSNNNNIKKN